MNYHFTERCSRNGFTYSWIYVYIKKAIPLFIGRLSRFDSGRYAYQSLLQFRSDKTKWVTTYKTRNQIADVLWKEYEKKRS